MCGIVGYIGEEQAAPILLSGLQKLEYRGYDSAGVAVYNDTGLHVVKSKGRLSVLDGILQGGKELPGTVGIGHTRWATHGAPSDVNSHPQVSDGGLFAVVHNGIIENYLYLKNHLIRRGVEFVSDTDTEVVAQMLEYYYKGDVLEAIRKVISRVEGSYALGIICADCPDRIFAVRKDSPLIIGIGKGENYIASDVPAILSRTRDIYRLKDQEIAVLTREGVAFYDQELEPITKEMERVQWDVAMEPKSSDIPTLLKKVYDEEFAQGDQAHTYGLGYNDVADWDIGDNVPFKLIASVPDADEIAAYDTYTYTFHDTLDASLDLLRKGDQDQTTFEIYFVNDLTIDPRDAKMQYLDAGKYDVTVDEVTNSFTITLDDLKNLKVTTAGGQEHPATDYNYVVIFYDAVLNKNAEIGLPGNENTAYLEFSNDPNGDGLGRTAEDTVIVFTYELDGTKVDGANVDTKLEGAQFVLFNGGHTRVAQIDENGKLVEWVNLPTGYNAQNYKEIPYEAWTGLDDATNVIMTSTAEGLFGVSGLDDGTYYLMEIKAPDGYNLLEDEVKLDIAATTTNGQEWTGVAADALTALNMTITVGEAGPTQEVEGNHEDGTVGVTVRNNQGATLPETGGMGTTLFYLIGGLLVVGAVVLLVVRIRMKAHNE